MLRNLMHIMRKLMQIARKLIMGKLMEIARKLMQITHKLMEITFKLMEIARKLITCKLMQIARKMMQITVKMMEITDLQLYQSSNDILYRLVDLLSIYEELSIASARITGMIPLGPEIASVTVKAGSYDAVTHEKFLLMTAIHFGLKINWNKILFDILKEMVTKSSKQAKGFAAQICVLLKGTPNLTLGEAKTFPPLKIPTAKTVGTYVAKNKNITAEEVAEEPPVKKVAKKVAAKRRPAPAVVEPTAKKKMTTVGRAAPTENNLALVPVVQDAKTISVVPAVSPTVQRIRASKRKLILQESDKAVSVEEIVAKVIAETAEIEMEGTETVEPVVMETTEMETVETKSRIDASAITSYDEIINFNVLSNEEGPLVETEKEKEKEKEKATEKDATDKRKQVEKIIDSEDTEPLSKVLELTEKSFSDEESMSIDEILQQIPKDMMLPSVLAEEPTNIRFGRGIELREVHWHKANLQKISIDAKGKETLVEKVVKGNPAKEMFSLICADIDFLVQLRQAIIEEISSFFHSFSLRSLKATQSVSDLAFKEEQNLAWAETDSLQTAVQRRMYIISKYKVLE
ncbi:hypothetical protein F511_32060 [Dorcoceras hygrometricum]|uniref:Splicing factor 3B subunit 1-like n=1 Tax=Dorcoceras hygrometricum TaxID=472368 RepID=A0A2Z7B293_9LAMI|nr:hypothetical protein F511_32060 [Dorcoceras hygrometricum]